MVLQRLVNLAIILLLAFPATNAWGSSSDSSLRLSGILVSGSDRSALINHRIVRTGERIGGAEILEISDATVILQATDSKHVLRIGSEISLTARRPAPRSVSPPNSASPAPEIDAEAQHRVARGETLSGIAARLVDEETDLNQAMLALFDTNPAAFGGNINRLFAGATLRLPTDRDLSRSNPTIAAAEVARHFDNWSGSAGIAENPIPESDESNYGPVAKGETLSAIAARVRPPDVSVNQMMIAVFRSNPHSFGGNINVLYEGATLRIPDLAQSAFAAPEVANTEVWRQNRAWQKQPLNVALTGHPTQRPDLVAYQQPGPNGR